MCDLRLPGVDEEYSHLSHGYLTSLCIFRCELLGGLHLLLHTHIRCMEILGFRLYVYFLYELLNDPLLLLQTHIHCILHLLMLPRFVNF